VRLRIASEDDEAPVHRDCPSTQVRYFREGRLATLTLQ
jgi:hypothetical protein